MSSIILRLVVVCSAMLFVAASESFAISTEPLNYRTYSSGQSLWIWDHAGMLLYRYDTKALKQIVLNDSIASDTVFDVIENSGVLWMVSLGGLYQVDMNTATIEHIPGGPTRLNRSKITADVDFAWVATQDTLWKFDKLSREWFAFTLGKNASPGEGIVGVYSDGNKVYYVTTTAVRQFSIADEKWSMYPYKNFTFSEQAQFFTGNLTLTVLEADKMYRYIIAKLSWDVVTAPSTIMDIEVSEEKISFLTGKGAFQYSTGSSVMQPLDIPDARNFHGLAVLNDTTLVLSGDKTLIQYFTTSRTTENILYPQQITGAFPIKIIRGDVLLYQDVLTLYNWSTRTWEVFRVPTVKEGRKSLTWDDNGLKMRYSPGFESQLKGTITQRVQLLDGDHTFRIDSSYNPATGDTVFAKTPIERLFYYTPSKIGDNLYSDLTLHTSLSGNRYADLFFKKEASKLPQKGLFYRGESDDYLESARLGTNTMVTPQSQTLPSVQFEGGSAIVHSKAALATRDRKIFRAAAGGGLKTTKTMYTVLDYNKDAQYSIGQDEIKNHFMIVPGSLRINVDGEDIDTLQYSFVPITGDLTFERRDLLDPTSVITAIYKIQTVPDSGLETVEIIPKNNFGQIEYGSASVSPVDWATVQGEYHTLQADSKTPRKNIATFMAPLEFRKSGPDLLLKLTPEMSLETNDKTRAGGLGLQSRVGDWYLGKATSFLFNYLAADSAFSTTDTLSRGYGQLLQDLNFVFEHDVLTELPIKYSESDRSSQYGTEHFREAAVGAHFQNLPFLDVTLSRNRIDVDNSKAAIYDTTADTLLLGRDKTKFKTRLYELSSPYLQSFLHLNKFGYDLSYTRSSSSKESSGADTTIVEPPRMPGTGDIFFGSSTIIPIAPITLTGQIMYKKNSQDSLLNAGDTLNQFRTELSPSLTLQTIDAPPGIDFNAYYSADYTGLSHQHADTSRYDTGQAAIQRKFYLIMKPGTWTKYLSWMSPRFGISQTLYSRFDTSGTVTGDIIIGKGGNQSNSVTKSFGVHLYPIDDILIRQENDYTTMDSIVNFHMFNDCKWWFGANYLWQTRWEANFISSGSNLDKSLHKFFTFYDVTWNSWLRTNEKLSADYSRIDTTFSKPDNNGIWYDTVATTKRTSFGPEVSASFNIQQKGAIKTFLNGHSAKISWVSENGRMKPGSTFTYNMFLTIIIKPNIKLETNNAVSWGPYNTNTYNGDLSASLLF